MVSAQDLTEDEEAEAVEEDVVDDVTAEDEDDEAEVEDDDNVELVSDWLHQGQNITKTKHLDRMIFTHVDNGWFKMVFFYVYNVKCQHVDGLICWWWN